MLPSFLRNGQFGERVTAWFERVRAYHENHEMRSFDRPPDSPIILLPRRQAGAVEEYRMALRAQGKMDRLNQCPITG
jgi:hypothetical protein